MWVQIKAPQTRDSLEASDLSVHVSLQREREASVDKQLTDIKKRQEKFEETEKERKSFYFKTMIGAAVSSVTSIIFVIIDYIKQ